MAFVVEIPTVFTQATQIPLRLGNTILSGNETIQGSLSVNGSFTLNDGSDNDNTVKLESIDISNDLNVGGQIFNPNKIIFRAYRKGSEYTINTNRLLPFDDVYENVGGYYSTSTYKFTSPVKGSYLFYLAFLIRRNTNGSVSFIRNQNGNETTEYTIFREHFMGTGETLETFYSSIIIPCEIGDEIYTMRTNGNIVLQEDNNTTVFGGFLIG